MIVSAPSLLWEIHRFNRLYKKLCAVGFDSRPLVGSDRDDESLPVRGYLISMFVSLLSTSVINSDSNVNIQTRHGIAAATIPLARFKVAVSASAPQILR